MPLFLVTVSRDQSQSFWVHADDKVAAQQDADALVDQLESYEWETTDTYVDVLPAHRIQRKPAPTDVIWRGGEHGAWEIVGGDPMQQVLAGDQVGQPNSGTGE